jgi:hypothetical protein
MAIHANLEHSHRMAMKPKRTFHTHLHERMTRLLLILALLGSTTLRANNIQVTNVTLGTPNTAEQSVEVQFTVSWENSWRVDGPPATWDAAWVFLKFRDAFSGAWQHCRLGDGGNHTVPAGTTLYNGLLNPAAAYNLSTNYGVGVFLHRSATGAGTFTASNVRLRWFYGQSGITFDNVTEVRVFALEMVNVAQGSFWLGDGAALNNRFVVITTSNPFQVTAETNPAFINNGGGTLGVSGWSGSIEIPVAFPKGFNRFYCMKHEISQQGYADFLNTLSYPQQAARTTSAPNSAAGTGALEPTNLNRNGIDIQTPGGGATPAVYACNLNGNTTYGEATDGLWLACTYLNWNDVMAYLDWSGLRPMTEFEFEKACRGPLTPVAGEYAWGTTAVGQALSITNPGAIDEEFGPTGANANHWNSAANPQIGLNVPVRVGGFAKSSSSRPQSGASYYGAMELSGNVNEWAIYAQANPGLQFTATHGNGDLTPTGTPDVATWPPAGTPGNGVIFRGGGFTENPANLCVSERGGGVGSFPEVNRNLAVGGRGVRSAP